MSHIFLKQWISLINQTGEQPVTLLILKVQASNSATSVCDFLKFTTVDNPISNFIKEEL